MEVQGMPPGEIQAPEGLHPARGTSQEAATVPQRVRKRRTNIFVGVCILNVVLFALFCTQLLMPAHNQNHIGANSTSAGLGDIGSPLIGRPAPDFTLPVLNGGSNPTGSASLHLAALKGRAVILNFWASWCAPCNDEAAFLQKSWSSMKTQGIVLIGIDGQEKASTALEFLQKYAISYPNVQDTLTSEIAANYEVTGLPETLFIDRAGIVVAKWDSPLDARGLQLEMAKFVQR